MYQQKREKVFGLWLRNSIFFSAGSTIMFKLLLVHLIELTLVPELLGNHNGLKVYLFVTAKYFHINL